MKFHDDSYDGESEEEAPATPRPKQLRPMLACPAPTAGVTFPVWHSPKLDGVRCLIKGGRAVSRSFTELPNRYVQQMLGTELLEGLDGELCVGPPTDPHVLNNTTSGVMSRDGAPDFIFYVFDFWNAPAMPDGSPMGYAERYARLEAAFAQPLYAGHPRIQLLVHELVSSAEALALIVDDDLASGFEGTMLRSPDGPYKWGRSTPKQQWLMKVKKFATGEARITGTTEMMVNENELEESALGLAKRSTAKDGMVPAGVLGSIQCEDLAKGWPFSVGSGFSAKERERLWQIRETLPGKILVYRHFELGAKNAPRLPIYHAFRDPIDLGNPDGTYDSGDAP